MKTAVRIVIAAGLVALGSACYTLFLTSSCVSHDNCPRPEQCINALCFSPLAWSDFAVTCNDDSECGGVECYDGYCYMTQLDSDGPGGGRCSGNHQACLENSYCGFDDVCVLTSEAGRVLKGEAEGFNAEIQIREETDVVGLNGVDVVAGHLSIGIDYDETESWSVDVEEMVFSDLKIITGNLIIKNQLVARAIRFPSLTTIGGEITIGESEEEANRSLREVSFPSLTAIGQHPFAIAYLQISENLLLSEVRLPLLTEVDYLSIELGAPDGNGLETPMPTVVDLGSIESANRFLLDFMTLPSTSLVLSLPARSEQIWLSGLDGDFSAALRMVERVTEDLWIDDATGTTSMDLSALTAIGDLRIDATTVASIEAPVLSSITSLRITDNASLTSLSFPLLTSANEIDIIGNAALDVCIAKAVVDGASVPPSDADLDGNLGDVAQCP